MWTYQSRTGLNVFNTNIKVIPGSTAFATGTTAGGVHCVDIGMMICGAMPNMCPGSIVVCVDGDPGSVTARVPPPVGTIIMTPNTPNTPRPPSQPAPPPQQTQNPTACLSVQGIAGLTRQTAEAFVNNAIDVAVDRLRQPACNAYFDTMSAYDGSPTNLLLATPRTILIGTQTDPNSWGITGICGVTAAAGCPGCDDFGPGYAGQFWFHNWFFATAPGYDQDCRILVVLHELGHLIQGHRHAYTGQPNGPTSTQYMSQIETACNLNCSMY